jgi:hypothetical protein
VVLGEQGRRGHRASWRSSSLGVELGRAVKPVFDWGGVDSGRSGHQSRENREGEASVGARRWELEAREQEAVGYYLDAHVSEATTTGGGRAQENGVAQFVVFQSSMAQYIRGIFQF